MKKEDKINIKLTEQEIEDILNYIEEELPEVFDNLTEHSCISCGARLNIHEHEEFEDQCSDCVWQETGGLIDDVPNKELFFTEFSRLDEEDEDQ